MVTIVKHEWHQVDVQYAIEIDEEILSEIYPDLDEDEIATALKQIEDGEVDLDTLISDAFDNDVELEWEHQYDDNWTMRKGGYDVTYELGDESSWHTPDTPPEPTHKCTKCKWTGQSYDADWVWPEDDESGEKEAKKVCPYCESDTELTEHGVQEEQERKERMARWEQEAKDAEEAVPCYSCGAMHKESELPELSGQYHCPDCHEGWVMMENRDEELDVDVLDLEEALDDLKREFEELSTDNTPAKWPFERPNEGLKKDEEQTDEDVLPNYPPGEYTIRIWGRTREIGVGTITKAQYDYWSSEDREYSDLSDALNENYDYDENDTPEEARFDMPYYEYQDVHSIWGFDDDDTVMTITNQDGEEIYHGDVDGFINQAHGDNDSRWEASEEIDEMYPHYLGKGTFVVWTQGGKGSCIQTTIVIEEGDVFDPRKLKTKTWDVDGSSIISRLEYDGVELDDEGMDSEHDNWRGQWSEFNVYENE